MLRHRWGSAKLYRSYYQDYKTFLSRPETVAERTKTSDAKRSYIVHSDLRQFYDRVRPEQLATALRELQRDGDDPGMFDFAARLFDWTWHPRDQAEVAMYCQQAGLSDFSHIALPQGLVSAGFFANVALLSFDSKLRSALGSELAPGVRLEDSCRYVDDFRIVVTVEGNELIGAKGIVAVEKCVTEWLQSLLTSEAPGLLVSDDKTKAAEVGGAERPLVRQSEKMNRIQSAVSGGFDAIGGDQLLDAIEGLVGFQDALSHRTDDDGWALSPLPDVKDETVARFAAARFRTTYRSIRPLLESIDPAIDANQRRASFAEAGRNRRVRTQIELDEDARVFALNLIERWVFDPSNVRLLRVGLDLWPDVEVLEKVLKLLRPFIEKGARRKAPRRVAWYCLSELLRAGATETGLVEDDESLPAGVDLAKYRDALRSEAVKIIELPAVQVPWYLRQQALLFLTVAFPGDAPVKHIGRGAETRHYLELIRYLRGDDVRASSADFATLAILSRRAYSTPEKSVALLRQKLTQRRIAEISRRDPSFALELLKIQQDSPTTEELGTHLRDRYFSFTAKDGGTTGTLAALVMAEPTADPDLRNELGILRFSAAFLERLIESAPAIEVVEPGQILISLNRTAGHVRVERLEIVPRRSSGSASMFGLPRWCVQSERWRLQLGFLVRFILTAQPDFTRHVRPPHWKEAVAGYRPAESHWYQRLYGMFNGQKAFGDDWLPITDWLERFLATLLHWPGSRVAEDFIWVEQGIAAGINKIQSRIAELERTFGRATETLMLPMIARRPNPRELKRPLRACVVQTVIPSDTNFSVGDLSLSDPAFRRKHRNHLSAALASVERMLDLRETHRESNRRLDWLILPELAVHPRDVNTHLIPFARAHRTMILAGLTYEELFAGKPLVNSALWIIPEWSDAHGLQISTRRQGKRHLAMEEHTLNSSSARLRGFRPCQWLIGFPWSADAGARPLWLTASVCYDATDLNLASDLRGVSDVFAVPALNRDVKTFDQMAVALHYHMFQLVVVANNGLYGGSNAYWPSKDPFIRQIFHLHGQPQSSAAFFEIDDIAQFLSRRGDAKSNAPNWKFAPAGLNELSAGD